MIENVGRLQDLDGVRIAFAWKKKGGDKLGCCERITSKNSFLCAERFRFLIWIAWDNVLAGLDAGVYLDNGAFWAALIDHELSHIGIEDDKYVVRKHDAEVFGHEFIDYPEWIASNRVVERAVQQSLFESPATRLNLEDLADHQLTALELLVTEERARRSYSSSPTVA